MIDVELPGMWERADFENGEPEARCEVTWPSDAPVRVDDPNTYRQHRCGVRTLERHVHVCRYCRVKR